MNNIVEFELHLFEKAAQSLGVAPTASWEQVTTAIASIENPDAVQRMAADVLMGTPALTRRLTLEAWHKKNKPDILKILRGPPPATDAERERAYYTRNKEYLRMQRGALASAKEKQNITIYFVYIIFGLYPVRNNTQSKRVLLDINHPYFMDMLKFLGLVSKDGFEGDEKVTSIELEPHINSIGTSSVRYEARYKISGKRGGVTEKTVHNGGTGWRRKSVLFEFTNLAWTDDILSTVLKRHTDKTLSAQKTTGVDTQLTVPLLGSNLELLQKEKEIYPKTIKEVERIIYILADKASIKKMKAAERSRQWRANHPTPSSDKEKRNAYMKEYRQKNKDALQKKQRAYTQKWRDKKTSKVS